ncbi:recombinase family protein [uncultured Tateyamaria sp.]|uniref:recombinase family protein n=1 Tax=uncultured Tateyamaria sp. TaxID=455651 RepID=UPI00261C85DB|nr:recombinase family protein [uncultured Tateyamaria sp.]
MKIVSYIRVSSEKQGQSGLGLEAQKSAIDAYAAANAADIIASFVEVESGRKNDRPRLEAALKQAKLTGSRLVIAKLDRLSRNAAFLLNLQEAKVDFVACDNENATPLTIGILALVAQEEAKAISERTKAALAACKARGVRLGNPNGIAAIRRANKGNAASCARQRADANARAMELADVLAELHDCGITSLSAQAEELNGRGIKTVRGGRWHPGTVANMRKRLDAPKCAH